MRYDFSNSSNRNNTNAEKYQLVYEKFGTKNIIPAWIADMDIDSPLFIQEAIKKRFNHNIFGYEMFPNSAFEAQISWLNTHYDTDYLQKNVLYVHSARATINMCLEAFSTQGDSVIVQTPVYGPFFDLVQESKREVIFNELVCDDYGYYTFDFDNLKKQIQTNTKLLLLCNPANPVGRAWKKEELHRLHTICKENNIIVISDELHCDLVYKPNKHIAFSTIDDAKDLTVSIYSIGKSFNLSGLSASTVIIQNEKLKEKFDRVYHKYQIGQGNIFSHIAFEEAYKNGYQWIQELKVHLYENYELLKKICDKHSHLVKISPIEATYLAWIDCKALGNSDEKINNFFIKEAKIGLNSGISFGKNGQGYVRLNFAMSKEAIKILLLNLDNALSNHK
jgi:cystathionine beta-lyase